MQNSTAMIDSTINKILSAQQVEPSANILPQSSLIECNNHQQQQHHTNEKPSAPNVLSTTEAEVRLVVKFIVEEHIVYQGEIKKVNQLENEELTRVVSRVAWDSIKNIDSVKLVGDTCDAVDKETAHSEQENDVNQSTNSPTQDEFEQQQNQLESESLQQCSNKAETGTVSSNSPICNETQVKQAPLSDHMIDEESSIDLQTTTTITTQQPSPLVIEEPSHSDQNINNQLIDSLKQPQNQDSKIISDSHTNIEEPPTDSRISDISPTIPHIQEPDKLPTSSDEDVFHKALELVSSPDPLNDEDTYIENQSIYDTLNDCINNVARETVFAEKIDSSPSTPVIDTPISIDTESLRQNGSPYLRESSDDMTTIGRNSNESSRDTDLCDKIFLTDDLLNDEARPSSNEASTTSSSANGETSKDSAKIPSVKRKSLNEHPSGKRMKRNNSKEQKNLTSKKGTPKTYENLAKKNEPSSTRAGTTMSLLVNNQQQIRYNKVFAKWSDNHFYPGVIVKQAKDRKFVISFVDGAQKDVSETDLIPLCNIEGKQVRVQIAKNYCYNAIVHDQRLVNDQPMFEVEYQHDGLVKKCVSWKDIFLTGEQGIPLANQLDRNSGASNFADVDLDNIIYEKRSRRLQDMEEFYFTDSSPHRTKTSLLL